MSAGKTPQVDAAEAKLARWEKRSYEAGMRGSHLDSDDPRPPDGFATARSLESLLADAVEALGASACECWDEYNKMHKSTCDRCAILARYRALTRKEQP